MQKWKDIISSPTTLFGAITKLCGAVIGSQVVLSVLPPPHYNLPVWLLTGAVSVGAITGYLSHYFAADAKDIPPTP